MFYRTDSPLSPETVAQLQDVLNQVCDEVQRPMDSAEARHAAGVLIRSYQRGIESSNLLIDIGRAAIRSPNASG